MIRQRRSIRSAALATVTAAAITAAVLPAAQASAAEGAGTPQRRDPAQATQQVDHNFETKLSRQQTAERKEAIRRLAEGGSAAKTENRNGSKVMKLGDKKYVELGREKTDKIFTILVDFGDQVDNTTMYDPDGTGPKPPQVKFGGEPGPAHNTIAEPDRSDDNSTEWQADYNQAHYQDMYFSHDAGKESMAKYYEKQSSGRYSVDGEVSDWVRVDYNEARYGGNWCGSTTCASVWDLVRDAVTKWVEQRKAAGATDEQIRTELAQFDQWDRYDYDGDGNFNEQDGYIDHFQMVHAGEDESAGGGVQGEDAIWAHRWYTYPTDQGRTGPADNKLGGTQIGNTGIWVGDYTVQPENGGLGVFAHEYGHDLGLPDNYDTAGGENSTAFWDLMSSGSWMGRGENAIGDLPSDMTAWDKLFLGWLDYDLASAATKSKHKLGVTEYNTKNPQALIVELPKKEKTTSVTTPAEGAKQWWSGMGDNLSNTLTRTVDLTGKSSASLSLKGWFQIEEDYDYLYTEVSTDGGATFTSIDGTVDGAQIPRDGGDAPALTGMSDGYQDLVYPLDAYAGQNIQLRFRYQSDGGVAEKGFAADSIAITADGAEIFADNAEGDAAGWTAKGFQQMGESFTDEYDQYYIVENRQYVSYDTTLATGPYNFGWLSTRPNWVEHFGYQNGMLVWLWDTSQADNNTSVHPGEGLILPVDANATPLKWANGTVMRNRIQAYDSTFSTRPVEGFTLHLQGEAAETGAKPAQATFDDHKGVYWYAENGIGSVKVPDTNTKITIVDEPLSGETLTVQVAPSGR
ncbi:Pre-pro-metalloprotease PrtV [Streptomyces sp. RB5]|uniref:Pre-pro-metalloprotease PrtV n=1 Tax=Streptomyces smaragdinus TaxID=2585196 RepID=A0A7K0CLS9_9ACTN|nr:immune inhibitor A domain-containing protein [Streptomyces smaragdinus]MQY13972.1 Pre-pro-metalloprotease PrtV [Streptomyces smaragdinus]